MINFFFTVTPLSIEPSLFSAFLALVFRCSDRLLFLGTLGVRFGIQKRQGGHSIPGGAPAVPGDGGVRGVVRT